MSRSLLHKRDQVSIAGDDIVPDAGLHPYGFIAQDYAGWADQLPVRSARSRLLRVGLGSREMHPQRLWKRDDILGSGGIGFTHYSVRHRMI